MTPEDRPELPNAAPASSPQAARRRLLRGSLATAPVLLTLVNRPVMASGACFAGSTSTSANLSRANAGFSCRGKSASHWSQENSFTEWPAPMASPGTAKSMIAAEPVVAAANAKVAISSPSTLNDSKVATESAPAASKVAAATTFDSVFGKQGGYDRKTLVQILALNSSIGRDGLACHLAAAYLNVLKGYIPPGVLDVPTVKNIWTSFIARGYYEPTAGIRWFPDYAEPANPRGGIIAWLKTTMTG